MRETSFLIFGVSVNVTCEYRLSEGSFEFITTIGNPAFNSALEVEGGKISDNEIITKLSSLPEFASIKGISNCYDNKWNQLVTEVLPVLQFIEESAEHLLPAHLKPIDEGQ